MNPSTMPTNLDFIVAAYVIGAVAIKGYALWLFYHRARIKRQLAIHSKDFKP